MHFKLVATSALSASDTWRMALEHTAYKPIAAYTPAASRVYSPACLYAVAVDLTSARVVRKAFNTHNYKRASQCNRDEYSLNIQTVTDPDYFNTDGFPKDGQFFKTRIDITHLTVFRSRLNGSASNSFLTVRTMGINVNPDRTRFRHSGVDTAYDTLKNAFILGSREYFVDGELSIVQLHAGDAPQQVARVALGATADSHAIASLQLVTTDCRVDRDRTVDVDLGDSGAVVVTCGDEVPSDF